MRKLLFLIIAVILIFPAVSFAYVISSSSTLNATLTATGGQQTWTAVFKRRSDNVQVSSFTWPTVSAGSPGYKIANQYIELTARVTNIISWRIIIYTDNTVAKTGFRPYTGSVSTAAVMSFGLVGQTVSPDGSKYGIPLCWLVLDVTSATPTTPVFSTSRPGTGTAGFTNYMWKFMQDKGRKNVNGTSAWNPASTYVRVWDNAGFYWNEDPSKAAASTDNKIYIYLGMDSTQTVAQFYTTKSLTLEAMQL
ncbi:MAG: hypothetical protein LHV68_04600 [Elusimicrobia bacterium]|nr:hypothetical protein [Candidatus Liberimonas magnetica]